MQKPAVKKPKTAIEEHGKPSQRLQTILAELDAFEQRYITLDSFVELEEAADGIAEIIEYLEHDGF